MEGRGGKGRTKGRGRDREGRGKGEAGGNSALVVGGIDTPVNAYQLKSIIKVRSLRIGDVRRTQQLWGFTTFSCNTQTCTGLNSRSPSLQQVK